MGKTFKDGASAKYKKHLVNEEELPIEFILGKKKQNLKKAKYNKKVDKEVIELEDENI